MTQWQLVDHLPVSHHGKKLKKGSVVFDSVAPKSILALVLVDKENKRVCTQNSRPKKSSLMRVILHGERMAIEKLDSEKVN